VSSLLAGRRSGRHADVSNRVRERGRDEGLNEPLFDFPLLQWAKTAVTVLATYYIKFDSHSDQPAYSKYKMIAAKRNHYQDYYAKKLCIGGSATQLF
jgi:hypothetical protein